MNGIAVWGSILNDADKGVAVSVALSMLAAHGVTPEDCQQAIDRIGHETAIGPMFDPTAYLDGTRFANARQYTEILRALSGLLKTMPPKVVDLTASPSPSIARVSGDGNG